jgi:hypothetical protein
MYGVKWSRNSSVGIAMTYGLDKESSIFPTRERDFLNSAEFRPVLGPTQSPMQLVP